MVSPLPETPQRAKEPESIQTDVPIKDPVPVQRIKPVAPIQPKPVRLPEPTHASEPVVKAPNSVDPEQPKNSVPEETIRGFEPPNNSINSDNSKIRTNSDPKPELKKPNETAPLTPFERIGKVGRQRKYEEKGNRGENSVRDVVLYRYIKGRHYPGLSSDMKRWYEFFYFKSPMRGEKPFNANTNHEQHVEAYERGREWIQRYEANHTKSVNGSLGDSRPIDLQARRAAH